VASILNQSYPHLGLHVLDNFSTDGTLDWLQRQSDPRLTVSTSDESLSIQESWARVKAVPDKSEFMTVIGHDDLFDETFLATIVKLIDRFPDASLYQTGSRLINEHGGTIRSCRPVPESEKAAEYLAARFKFERDVFGTGYVMRSKDYDGVGGIPPFEKLLFADDALWLSLMKGSFKACDPAERFSVRIHPGSESASLPSAWESLLLGLNDFNEFLAPYVEQEPDAKQAVADFGGGFQVRYHQNLLIFALVQASQSGKRIDESVVGKLQESLAMREPEAASALRRGAGVWLVSFLNASPLRGQVGGLWKLYSYLKSRTFR